MANTSYCARASICFVNDLVSQLLVGDIANRARPVLCVTWHLEVETYFDKTLSPGAKAVIMSRGNLKVDCSGFHDVVSDASEEYFLQSHVIKRSFYEIF